MPNFDHRFDPPSSAPAGSSVDLSTREIEDAGLFEVLQTPGAALGTWSLFNALIDTTTSDFRFHEPLGRSREVKTALSGLFGRFVARAYANKYLNYRFFSCIHSPPMPLAFGLGLVERIESGDLPDWAVWGPSSGLGIVEAKGSHDWPGPAKSLGRAYEQAGRVTITLSAQVATFKRYAIATRWGFMTNGPERPMLWVKDPDEAGDALSKGELDRLGFGVARRHYASLLKPLGHPDLAEALLSLARAKTERDFIAAQGTARAVLAAAPSQNLTSSSGPEPQDPLIGGFVTRAGPLDVGELVPADREALHRLGLGPTFIGVEIRTLVDIIEGNIGRLVETQAQRTAQRQPVDLRVPRDDGTGAWVFRINEDVGVLS